VKSLLVLMAVLRLQDAVDAAMANHPAVAGADARRGVAEARLSESKAAWLPHVSASETVMRSDNPGFVFGSLLEQGRFGANNFDPAFLNDPDPLGNFRLALNVRYTVFDQLRRLHTVEQARNAVEQAGFGTEEVRQQIRAETIARFYGVLLAREKRNVAEESVKSAEADAASMRDRFEQGLLVESDLLAAEVQLASFRQSLIEAESELAISNAGLATLLHAQSIEVEGRIPDAMPAAPALDAAVQQALASRGDVQSAGTAAENARLQVKIARGSMLPRVDTFASWGASSSSLTGGDPDSALGVVIGVDLFDPRRSARVAASRSGLDAARAEEAAARDRVTMEVVTAWHRSRSAGERIAVARKSVESAETANRIVRDRYDAGLTTITEHLRAQTALLAARLSLLAARYDAVVHHAELQRATGGLQNVEAFH
jgi:outer membrane protein TolC